MNNHYLMDIQAEWLMDRANKKLHDELFMAVYEMSVIQVKSICKHYKLRFARKKISMIAIDVTVSIMERYYKPNWHVHTNYIQAIRLETTKKIFDKRYIDKIQYIPIDKIYYKNKYENVGTEPTFTDRNNIITKHDFVTDLIDINENMENNIIRKDDQQELRLDSPYYEDIIALVDRTKTLSAYLLGVAEYHSFGWMGEHMYSLRNLWQEKQRRGA